MIFASAQKTSYPSVHLCKTKKILFIYFFDNVLRNDKIMWGTMQQGTMRQKIYC